MLKERVHTKRLEEKKISFEGSHNTSENKNENEKLIYMQFFQISPCMKRIYDNINRHILDEKKKNNR